MNRFYPIGWLLIAGLLGVQAQEVDMGTEQQVEAGRKLYMQKCAHCHGEEGDGNGVAKPFFRPQPRDFTAATFKFRSTLSGELPTTEDIKRSIKKGMPYTGMPGWPQLSDEEITDLAYFIKTFSEEDFRDFGNAESITIPDPPPITEESIQRGRIVYEENQCADCHGDKGRGNGKSAPTLKDQWDQPIRPADLTKRWTFRGGPTRKDIYRTFTTGLDGSPMPSYDIQPQEDKWALVNYVYSLGASDEPNYAIAAVAVAREGALELSRGRALFEDAPAALFPVVGQVVEPGRNFYPGVNAIEVRAVYNQEDIAIMLTWHDMTADTTGHNAPDLEAPPFDPEHDPAAPYTGEFSDAVAIQFPSKMPEGAERPYFLFGDAKRSVDLWFADLAKGEPAFYIGRGSENIRPGDQPLEMVSRYDDGEWMVIFKRRRAPEKGLAFVPETFVPIAFSVWDGFNNERGNRRGITSWYHLYLEPMEKESPLIPTLRSGLITFVVLAGLVGIVRLKYRS